MAEELRLELLYHLGRSTKQDARLLQIFEWTSGMVGADNSSAKSRMWAPILHLADLAQDGRDA
eukprot:8519794-Pyramimonas_sp.AAC.1